jgi:hypothetical protein
LGPSDRQWPFGHCLGVGEPATILVATNQPINMPITAVQRGRGLAGPVNRVTCRELLVGHARSSHAMPLQPQSGSDAPAGQKQNNSRAKSEPTVKPVVAGGRR